MTMQKSAIQKRIEAQLAAPSHTREDSNVNKKKPVPLSLAQFALEQIKNGGLYFANAGELAAALGNVRCMHDLGPELIAEQVFSDLAEATTPKRVEQTGTNRAEELIADLEAEIVKRDVRIAELEAAVAHRDRSISSMNEAHWLVVQELAALKAQQPSAGVALPDRVPYENPGSEYFHGYNAGWTAGLDKVARLNAGRAVAVPNGLKEIGVIDESDDGVFVDLHDDQSFKLGQKVYSAAPSAQQKESE